MLVLYIYIYSIKTNGSKNLMYRQCTLLVISHYFEFISIKPHLVTNSGERLIVSNIVRKGSSFRERSNFPRIWIRDPRIRIWGLEIKHLIESKQLRVTRVFFLSLLSRNFDDRLKLNLSQVCYFMHMLRYTKWEYSIFDNYQ